MPDAARLAPHFAAMREAHARAADRAGLVSCAFDIAGLRVAIHLAGPALERPLTRAFDHLVARDARAADLTVWAFDTASTGVPLPDLDWSAPGPAGAITAVFEGTTRTLSMVGGAAAIYWIHDAGAMPSFESGAPLRAVLACWLAGRGRTIVHAAAVGAATGGVLLAGRGGSGKSTTALGCIVRDSGLSFAGEDYVAVAEAPEPYVHSLYQSAKLVPGQHFRVPGFSLASANPGRTGGEKALYFLHEAYADRLAAGFPLRAILLPRVTGGAATRLVPATPKQALDAVLPSSVVQLPGLGRGGVQAFARLAQRVPAYTLELGHDLARIPDVIRATIA